MTTASLSTFGPPTPEGLTSHRMGVFGKGAFAASLCAIAFESSDGIRLGANVTLGDAFLVVGGLLIVCDLAGEGLASIVMPGWLLGSGALLMTSALIVEMFSPGGASSFSTHFAQGSLYSAAHAAPGTNPFLSPTTAAPSNLLEAGRFIGTLVLLPSLIASVGTSALRLTRLANAWVAGAALSSAVALLHAAGIADLGLALTGGDYNINLGPGASLREAGLSAQPVLLALSCTTAFPIVLAHMTVGSLRKRTLSSILAFILALGALASGSRAGLIGLAVGVALLPFIQPAARRAALRVAIGAGVFLMLLVITGASFLPVINRIVSSSTLNSAGDASRLSALSDGLKNFIRSPVFGNGYEYIHGAHDVYAQLLQGGGVIALLGFLLFASATLRVGYVLAWSPRLSTRECLTARALVSAMAVWLVLGIIENPIQDRFLYVPVGLILGLNALGRRRRIAAKSPTLDPLLGKQIRVHESAVGGR